MSEILDQLASNNGTLADATEGDLPVGTQEPVTDPAAPASETFEVDGKLFSDEKTAFEHLKKRNTELEAESMVEAARIEGMQDAMRHAPQGVVPQNVQAQVQANPEMNLDEFYADPAAYLDKQRQQIKADVMKEVTSHQSQAQKTEQIWNDFSSRHPQLADMRDIVDLVASQNAEVVSAMANRNPDKAYDFVAAKVKEKFSGFVDSQKPTRELPAKGGVSAGGNQPVTPLNNSTKSDKPLDFISQVKQHRNR